MRPRLFVRVFAVLALVLWVHKGQAEPMVLQTPTGELAGILELPKAEKPSPVALIIAGSGPTDRDGNTPALGAQNNSLKMLAEALAKQGIASVRYDKRGVGESAKSAPPEADLRFSTYVNDAIAWGQFLKKDARFSSLFLIGHSEGSLIGMLAAQQLPLAGFVSIAGAGQPAATILREQLKPQLPPELMQSSDTILQSLSAGKTVDNVPGALEMLFRPSVQPYLISWFPYDPTLELKKLKLPVLLVQGSTDIQVKETDVGLLSKALPGAKVLRVEGMNHILKMVPADLPQQLASYSDSKLPISPALVQGIEQFIRAPRS